MKILLIKQTSLGDVLHMTPVIRALKKWKPDCTIDVVTDKRALGILENNPYINKLYVLDIYRYETEIFKSPLLFFSTIREFFSHIKDVRKEHYDIAMDLQGLERSVIFLYLCHSKKKYAKGKWLGLESNYYKDINAIEGLLSFLKFIDCPDDGTDLDYFLPKNIDIDFAERIEKIKYSINSNFDINSEYIVFSPFSRWDTKDLSVNKSREIIKEIQKLKDIQIIVSATSDYDKECSEIVKGFDNVLNTSGLFNLPQLAYLIRNSKGMITVDSFPMHTGCAFQKPLIAIFGPTSEVRVGPIAKNSETIRVENLECARCYKRKNCPNNHICIENIDAEKLAKRFIEKLQY
ncbi:glycosyltransferase family 9 protein [Brachyspira hyodysenteriae]|uniref:glycosyltransferase family 9 protein n=1 Tax=Brachyspira hyodysenteriae TaxID=159 RepID=UPI00063DC294|nr:glycosyltransferase family 9 protein [Brachyspira hyodysenteriae]KLI20870.1 lipopolysaccharide heptosyltransferase [Brachyspira hyodysenteriae]